MLPWWVWTLAGLVLVLGFGPPIVEIHRLAAVERKLRKQQIRDDLGLPPES